MVAGRLHFHRTRIGHLARKRAWVLTIIAAMMATTIMDRPLLAAPNDPPRQAAKAIRDKEFLALPEAYLAAQRNFDVAALSALTASNFVEISPVGEVDNREKMLSFYAPDKKRPAPAMRYEQVHAWKNGASGTIIGKVIYTIMPPGGEARTSELTAAFQLHKSKGKWKLVAAQYTPVRNAR